MATLITIEGIELVEHNHVGNIKTIGTARPISMSEFKQVYTQLVQVYNQVNTDNIKPSTLLGDVVYGYFIVE